MAEGMAPLVPYDVYERHAVHIGTNQKSADMRGFLDHICLLYTSDAADE